MTQQLTKPEVERYSRQVILPEIGPDGMRRLLEGKVLIVGAGGLASSAGLYLAGAGVGVIGFADFDKVEVSNLHRQIIHTTERQGMDKVESAKIACLAMNPTITINTHKERFTSENGVTLVSGYDVVVDATDNITSRYLINDACVLASKALVSGSALKWEGQMSVYNYKGGPCYRCAYPNPPPIETVTSCADGGVVGAVPGTIGCLQAIEAQKILMGAGETMSGRILLFNALQGSYNVMKHRPKSKVCKVCGDNPTLTKLVGYEEYVKKSCEIEPVSLPSENEMSCEELHELLTSNSTPHTIIDVRTANEYSLTKLPNTVNVPLSLLTPEKAESLRTDNGLILLLCRRGIASAHATRLLLDADIPNVKNITKGLTRWAQTVDKEFPIY
eukprot:TRINITY_DN6545_c0_g1_i1.p1 TRINITY_DN6545_c0_g1~~TRINITY_DN6545_c0_g1_i1.p1  ORF type:complete len:388 (+),score=68.23 TRINITY_DN6545_c0_g1_i1:78-1241(+)